MRKAVFVGLITLFLVACKNENNNAFNGYIDTDLVYLSSDFAGRLVNLSVLKGELVNANQFLFRLEQTNESNNVKISQFNSKELLSQREQILAQLDYSETNYRRISRMRNKNAASQGDLDVATKDLNVLKQQLAEIDVKIQSNQVDTADKKWKVTRKENFAPAPGIIFDTYYKKAEFIQAGYPIVSLITKDNIKTIFFVPEKELSKIRLNQKVEISTDDNKKFARGHIFYISNIAEYTPPIIYSREERQRLVFRVEAKIDSPDLEQLHLGQPVTLELER